MVDVDSIKAIVWCQKYLGWSTTNKLVKWLQNPCNPREPTVAYQLKMLRLNAIAEGVHVNVLVTRSEFDCLR